MLERKNVVSVQKVDEAKTDQENVVSHRVLAVRHRLLAALRQNSARNHLTVNIRSTNEPILTRKSEGKKRVEESESRKKYV